MYFKIEKPLGGLIRIDKYIPVDIPDMDKYPDKYIKINSKEDGENIKKALEEGKDVLVKDGKFEIRDYHRKYDISAADKKKYAILEMAESFYQARVNEGSLLDYLYYIDINNELNSRGYFITETNKESEYLKILETGDDKLIDLLEEFLIIKDQLSALKTARQTFIRILEKLNELQESDVEELEKLEKEIQ